MESNNPTSTLQLFGEIDLSNADDARGQVRSVLEEGNNLNINLEQVSYMSSTGVAVLIEAMQETQRLGLKLSLVDVSEEVMQVLELAHLHTILPIASKSSTPVNTQQTGSSSFTQEQDPFDSIFGGSTESDNQSITSKDDSSNFNAMFDEPAEHHNPVVNAEKKASSAPAPKTISRNPFIG